MIGTARGRAEKHGSPAPLPPITQIGPILPANVAVEGSPRDSDQILQPDDVASYFVGYPTARAQVLASDYA